jgi:hypothetical protein
LGILRTWRREDALSKALLADVPFMAATEWENQQEESEELGPHMQSPGYDRRVRQSQILVDSERT